MNVWKVIINLESILKSIDTTLSTKVCLVTSVVFPVVMYGCESWAIKKIEHQRTDAFELWCWRRLLDCKVKTVNPKGNQSWIFIERTDAEVETPILWPPDAKSWLFLRKKPWSWERLKAGEGDYRGWDGWMASPTQWTLFWISSRSWWWTGKTGMLQSMGSQRAGHSWVTELNWTHSGILLSHQNNKIISFAACT